MKFRMVNTSLRCQLSCYITLVWHSSVYSSHIDASFIPSKKMLRSSKPAGLLSSYNAKKQRLLLLQIGGLFSNLPCLRCTLVQSLQQREHIRRANYRIPEIRLFRVQSSSHKYRVKNSCKRLAAMITVGNVTLERWFHISCLN